MSTRIRRQYGPERPPVQRREVWAWMMFDFANSGYTTVVITAVFSAYFVGTIAGGAEWATFAWTAILSASYLLIMLAAPFLGAYADIRGNKKALLMMTTGVCVLGTAGLGWMGAGSIGLAMVLVFVSNTAFGTGENLISAFLPELAQEQALGRVSGWGWALGYLGGLLVLAICLWWIMGAEARGAATADAVAQSMWITAVCFVLASLPTFLLLRERVTASHTERKRDIVALAWRRLRESLAGGSGLRDLRRFLWCIVSYQAGVATVIAIAAIFTTEALGFTTQESIQLILVVNITAAIGAFAFGQLQDRLGHARTLSLALWGWLLAIGLFWFADTRTLVWVAANLAGVCMGASQSAGRALVGYLCPPNREAEIFGLWGLAVKFASILGPLCYGAVSWASGGNHRIAMLVTSLFFVVGLALLRQVDVTRGRAAACQSLTR